MIKVPESYKHEFVKILNGMSFRTRVDMFRDFIETFAIRLNLVADIDMSDVRIKRFKEIMKRHSEKDREVFGVLGRLLIEALKQESKDGPADVLSEVYHRTELADKQMGESFTPPDITMLAAQLCLAPERMIERIREKGYTTVYDCCSGAGGMFLAFARVMYANKLNYCKQLYVEGWDIDLISVCMSYIQLTLNGIPAKVIERNTITLETKSVWHTLTYVTGGWETRLQNGKE